MGNALNAQSLAPTWIVSKKLSGDKNSRKFGPDQNIVADWLSVIRHAQYLEEYCPNIVSIRLIDSTCEDTVYIQELSRCQYVLFCVLMYKTENTITKALVNCLINKMKS